MESNKVTLKGVIYFDPDDKTNKHKKLSSVRRTAMVLLDPRLKEGDKGISDYYAWFIANRYNLILNRPLRGAHVTIINDYGNRMNGNWDKVKAKWHKKEVDVTLFLDPRTDDRHWWLTVPEEDRELLHSIRTELGLGRPHWGLHMTIGYANEKNIEHSKYIHRVLTHGPNSANHLWMEKMINSGVLKFDGTKFF
jgi:hypothetical protein